MAISLARLDASAACGDRGETPASEHVANKTEARLKPFVPSNGECTDVDAGKYARTVQAFVWLGVALRVGHYLINYPLWGDEAFLAYNFVRRGYLDLLTPLEYGQICPILFMWAELTAVKLFGFSEMSLRLCPLLCGVASVFLFRHVAGRILTGRSLLLAVAIFAVSIHPIRHSADAKPYASDLFVALGLFALAIEWYRRPERARILWLMAGLLPFALAASYPAVMVAAGIALALAPSVWKTYRRGTKWAFAAYLLVFAASVGTTLAVNAYRPRNPRVIEALNTYWSDSYPPIQSPVRLARWLVTTHAGNMLAYPWGGNRGASSGTLVLVIVAAIVLWRRDRKLILTLMASPLVLALAVAALKRYPYGGQARIMQYMAPGICIMAGLGLATLLSFFRRPGTRIVGTRIVAAALAIGGIALFADEFRHPYRAVYDDQARTFARQFWPAQTSDAEILCMQSDLGIRSTHQAVSRTALYLCNQHIYSPSRQSGATGPRWNLISSAHPLRCIVFDDVHMESSATRARIGSLEQKYSLRRKIDLVVPTTDLDMSRSHDSVYVLEFEPRHSPPPLATTTGTAARSVR